MGEVTHDNGRPPNWWLPYALGVDKPQVSPENKERYPYLERQFRGWLLPYIIDLDTIEVPPEVDPKGFPNGYKGHGRWYYWLTACERAAVPEDPIPQIHFTHIPHREDAKHIQDVLRVYVNKGYWYDDAWLMFVRWLLHGFGDQDMAREVERIPPDVRNTWYTMFNLAHLLNSHIDWSAHVLQGGLPAMNGNGRHKWAKSTAFYSTPMNVVNAMTEMLWAGTDPEDAKVQTVCDPCCGTGSMFLPASNHTFRIYGADIVPDLVLCIKLNGWLFIPWMVVMPKSMSDTFAAIDGMRGWPVHLETDPERVAATQAYREGDLSQGDFFSALGMA